MQIVVISDQRETDSLLVDQAKYRVRISDLLPRPQSRVDSEKERELLNAIVEARSDYVISYEQVSDILLDEKNTEEAWQRLIQLTFPLLLKYRPTWSDFVRFQADDRDEQLERSPIKYVAVRTGLLAALKITLSLLQEDCKAEPTRLAMVSDVAQLADQAIQDIRTISYLLHPPLLDEVGFACAAEWYIEGFAKRSGINVRVDIATPSKRLPKRMEIALFRVLQESLTNVHRHSGASDASIQFKHDTKAVTPEIRDFGSGIPEERLRSVDGVSTGNGVGLAGMRERLCELNGKLEIESDGRGTSLRAIVPLYQSTVAAEDDGPLVESRRA
jgi:signal transduction histidine kinase